MLVAHKLVVTMAVVVVVEKAQLEQLVQVIQLAV
jgi:hypothetical protein